MFSSTHASVGQNQGRMTIAPEERTISSNCKMQIANCKLPIADRLYLSPVPRLLSPRYGISLVEVLIAMGILTIGLLGVAALFPVGAFYMQKGDVADQGSAVAQAAFNDLLSRGILDPQSWLMWEDGAIRPSTTANPPAPNVSISPGTAASFTRRFSDKLGQQLVRVNSDASLNPTAKQWNTGVEFGAAFVIDPIASASVSWPFEATNIGTKFPATGFNLDSTNGYYSTSWQPWYYSAASAESQLAWPIRRVTVPQGPLTPLSMRVAEKLFTSSDDLAIELPTARDKPSQQRLQLANLDGGGGADDPVARQSRGDYSWIAMVSPGSSDARNALASDPSAYSYEVSVAVFHKRVVGKVAPQSDAEYVANKDLLKQSERLVRAKVVSTGLSGGELLLEKVEPTTAAPTPGDNSTPTESPFAGLKAGNWYLLAGPHPSSSSTRPMFVARWYRVLSVEGKDSNLDASGNPSVNPEPERRLVALRGAQWPWQPQTGASDTSNNLCLAIVPNVVAVHSKTIRLEGKSAWSMR